MSPTEHAHVLALGEDLPLPALLLRCALGGILMGLANLVPGISGGTMLLAAGVYPLFVDAIAELSTLRFRLRPILALGSIAVAAALVILLLAGTMKTLVIEQRFVMYSLFIGLTLGGVPLVWRLARPATPALWLGAALAFGAMALMSHGVASEHAGETGTLMLLFAGLAGASAMILPGVSGGYLLLLLGQYEGILGAIDELERALLSLSSNGPDIALLLHSLRVVVPVGLGVVAGVVGVSNLLRWLLHRFEKATLGVLLGLLLGAVIGLYPFQRPVSPQPGFTQHGVVLSDSERRVLDAEFWPIESFHPSAGQLAGSGALVLLGLGATLLVARIGPESDS